MTREQAKKNLIAFGIEAPTEEQITNYLNQVKTEVDPFRDKANKTDELQTELDKLNQQGMTELEKANKAIEDSNKIIAELTKQVNKSEVKAIFGGAGLTEDDYKDLIDGIVSDDLETSKSLASNFVTILNKQKEVTESKVKEGLLKETPGGSGKSDDGNSDLKTEAEKIAETLGKSMANADVQKGIKNYL